MTGPKILLGLDGSAQTRYAAELAWAMAKVGDCRVDAQHVIDSLAAWDFLSFDIAGLIGSEPYFEAHETMHSTLKSIGETLTQVYADLAKAHGVKGEAFLDDGTTIRELCSRASDYDLVILGQRSTGMQSPNEDNRKLPRRSVAETLTHYCPKPLLIIQDRPRLWSKMRIVLGSGAIDSSLLASCAAFAEAVGMEVTVQYLCQQSAAGATDGVKVAQDLCEKVGSLKGQKVDVRVVPDVHEYWKDASQEDTDTLLVVPVQEKDGIRTSAFGMTPDVIVRYLSHPAVLFWMQGEAGETNKNPVASAATAV